MLSVGDKSGTVEVDPELEGVQLDHDADFDDVAAPPQATPGAQIVAPVGRGSMKAMKPAAARSAVQVPAPARSTKIGAAQPAPKARAPVSEKTPTLDLLPDADSDILEVDETNSRVSKALIDDRPGAPRKGASAVQRAVQMPSGPIDISGPPPPMPNRGLPGVPPMPLPPAPQPPRGNPIAAALPTVAAMQPPQQQMSGLAPPNGNNAFAQTMVPPSMGAPQQLPGQLPGMIPPSHRQTMIAAAQPPPPPQPMHAQAYQVPPNAQPNWGAVATAAATEPTAAAAPMDPSLAAMLNGMPDEMGRPSGMPIDPSMIPMQQHPSMSSIPIEGMAGPKTGIRKARSKLQIAMWILVGVVVIGGGVFAGFQIRAMRLNRQVAAARKNAMELTRNDTFANWTAARDELSRIVQASGTAENFAALARARALIAYEFDDGVHDARVTVDALKEQNSVDAHVAKAYLALAEGDVKAAREASQAAVQDAADDPSANYVASQVALAQFDFAEAIKYGKVAVDKDARPLFVVGLAKAYAMTGDITQARANITRALSQMADQPSAVIALAEILAESGAVMTDKKTADDTRSQLAKLVGGDAKKSQLSPAQLAFGGLALAELDFARNDQNAARADVTAAGQVGLDDQRFAEAVVDTLYDIGQLGHAGNLAKDALKAYAKSTRLHLAIARVATAQGNGNDALAALKDIDGVEKNPVALAERGNAKLALGDIEGARKDLDAAQKLAPKLEAALVGRAWVELVAGDADLAHGALKELDSKDSSPAVMTINAAIMRRDPNSRDKAKAMLEALAQTAPGPDVVRAQLELARVDRDMGDFTAAHKAYGEASKTGNFDARLESGLLLIEDRDPNGGRETLDALLKAAGDKPTANLVLETARARMLAGDHEGAATLLATADNLPNVQKWKLLRERGRLALRRSDFKSAIQDLGQALEGCGSDPETFLLAADAATSDMQSGLTDKVKKLLDSRLKGVAELQIINGKLALGIGKFPEAEVAYKAARDQLKAEKGSPRRMAQTSYGLAVVAYQKQKDADAYQLLGEAIADDPSIYDAYLFKAELEKSKAAAYDAAKTAVKYNGDYPRGWNVYGKKAAMNGDKAALAQAIERLKVLAPSSDELKELEKLK
ncbi:MAG: tetratricopeptide repeat protein [Kofleriaceae bacterium]